MTGRLVTLAIIALLGGHCIADDHEQVQGHRFHNPSHIQDKDHIREHMEEMMTSDELEKLKLDNEEAMEFHYFKLHDYDNNNKLDGLELAVAMTHYEDPGPDGKRKAINIDDEELAHLVDQIMKDDDLNNDGYVDYYEFQQAQRRHH